MELRTKKGSEPQTSVSVKAEPGACQTSYRSRYQKKVLPAMTFDEPYSDLDLLSCRPKRNVNLSKADMKSNPAVFNFRSDERAERRKEASK